MNWFGWLCFEGMGVLLSFASKGCLRLAVGYKERLNGLLSPFLLLVKTYQHVINTVFPSAEAVLWVVFDVVISV